MIKIVRFEGKDKKLFKIAQSIRTEVFVEEQNVQKDIEYDDYDKIASHYLAYLDGLAIATARWIFNNNGIKLERFATLKQYRNKKAASYLLKRLLEDTIGFEKLIYLHAQVQVIKFYEKFGFTKIGEIFEEAGIQHSKMVFK